MLKRSAGPVIKLRGVRHNNLKNFDLDLPSNQLIVITGLSGSGKSSLAFDTLFAEGQRRYIETFSPYARQFLDRMDKPQVDSIEGIPPAIAIEQRNSVKTTRSTVGTMTEICDFMKCLWERMARLHCRQCGQRVGKEPPQDVWKAVEREAASQEAMEALITFDLPLTEKLSLPESLALVAKQGYQRLIVNDRIVRLEEVTNEPKNQPRLTCLTVLQDRVVVQAANRARFIEACEQAYHFGKGRLCIFLMPSGSQLSETGSARRMKFSNALHCATCDIEYRPPSQALFSFNHPVGACPACKGFGRVIGIDYGLAVPDTSRTLAEGVVRPWQTGQGLECQSDLLRMCRTMGIPTDVPFNKLPKKLQDRVIDGAPDYGKDEEHEWPHVWYGVKGYFRWLESRAYKMHVRVLLSRYRSYTTCPACGGARFQPEALLYRTSTGLTLADFYQLPVSDAVKFMQDVVARLTTARNDPLALASKEVLSRLEFLAEVGLGYLTLDRPTRSLSGGETERVNLTTCLGSKLVNTLFVLDEPSVGLHPQDTARLVTILERLRDAGNTVVVVEHEAAVMRAADQLIDLGPGHGSSGGEIVFQGAFADMLVSSHSLTGQYLSGRKRVEMPTRRPVKEFPGATQRRAVHGGSDFALREAATPFGSADGSPHLRITGAKKHNLKELSVTIPLKRLVCISGVSGSGKTTLVREILAPALERCLRGFVDVPKASERLGEDNAGPDEEELQESSSDLTGLEGWECLQSLVVVDQSTLSKTPRSNPAVYIGAFDAIREVFAQSTVAKRRGLNASAFSFNSGQGQCERCRGAGFEKIEMQFLSDVYIQCPECRGRRYRSVILEVKISPPIAGPRKPEHLSIADLLELTADDALGFLQKFTDSTPASAACNRLRWLCDLGLGYLKLGQPLNTLSGGESQRLKLAGHLAEAGLVQPHGRGSSDLKEVGRSRRDRRVRSIHGRISSDHKGTLFIFDEPTTGLHFGDVAVLMRAFQRLVDDGHSVLVIEHNLDVLKCADWLIDLGPGGGDAGGTIVAVGTPESVAACPESATGAALKGVLQAPQEDRTSQKEATRV
jgi:excinuclease ABC subunit A